MTWSRWSEIEDRECRACILPGGYRDQKGGVHRDVVLAPMTGRQEDLLADRIGTTPVPLLVTALLASCLRRLGPLRPVPVDVVRDLPVGDRAFLLLKLRQLSFGQRVAAVLNCPACEHPMDLAFSLDQIPVETGHPAGPAEPFEIPLAASGLARTVQFRLPTGADQEILATAPGGMTEERAVTILLARCLLRLGDTETIDEHGVLAIDLVARIEIEERMQRYSSSVDLDLEVTCPECGHGFVQPFDYASLMLTEIRLRRPQLYREVHLLALHYHWSEREILGLTRDRRRTYLALLRDGGREESLTPAGAVT